MCPAVIFALSRKESVMGRTMCLRVSIKTRGVIKIAGLSPGKVFLTTCRADKNKLLLIIVPHINNPTLKTLTMCAVNLAVYGVKPHQFIKQITLIKG